jgi:hypothetical protein
MKKILISLSLLFLFCAAIAQVPATDIYVADVVQQGGNYMIGTPIKITNNPGYDNQPSFTPDGLQLLYTSMHDTSQTDIYSYNFKDFTTTQISHTPESEYSPVMLYGTNKISVVRVNVEQAQQLYSYYLKNENDPYILVPGEDSVAYYGWLDQNKVAINLLNGNKMHLKLFDLKSKKSVELMDHTGRCMMKFPGSTDFLFTRRLNDSAFTIIRYHTKTGEMESIIDLPLHTEDYTITPAGKILIGKDGKLLINANGKWKEIADVSSSVGSFYRLAMNASGTKIAFVSYSNIKP